MFPNLNAEQARHGHTNQEVANLLNLARSTYETKKRTGHFSLTEINILCDTYDCDYSYLFCEKPIIPDRRAGEISAPTQ